MTNSAFGPDLGIETEPRHGRPNVLAGSRGVALREPVTSNKTQTDTTA